MDASLRWHDGFGVNCRRNGQRLEWGCENGAISVVGKCRGGGCRDYRQHILFIFVGMPILFGVIWGCSPYHRIQPDPEPCSGMFLIFTAVAVGLVCLLAGTAAFLFARKLSRRWLKS